MSAGAWAVVAAVVVTAVVGVLLRWREGRVRVSGDSGPELPSAVRAALDPGAAVTLVQLSTTFCAPCRHTRVLLADLAGRVDGLRHVELDVTNQPEVATRLGVLRTPTTLALDASGAEVLRVGGVPKRDVLLEALRPHLPHTNG
ncbi:thiol-disulfide isomerase/thioredoxin [Saccharothrix coeruleofusca]|uniref:TlpA family protein disulfide reductase n=1 Tax=Saccharothrix coeruleofusca TaxID=33919 RepID=UPI001AE3E0B1|nr:thioredoxin family protein [Saccharothrix coeruleofusca]MBP2339635.1 thiol-disulfide isomerase/thioredoxin [Saccharothrix coeruleofusca]